MNEAEISKAGAAIDGRAYAQMLSGGAAMLCAHVDELNALNVFPVADGDTGTNMLRTIEGGLPRGGEEIPTRIGAVSGQFSKAILLSARGNSGVILSQIFAGINEVLQTVESATALTLAEAYRHGVQRSYAAVQNPTEGTILTVFRESTEYAASRVGEDSTPEDFFRFHLEEARRSLAATKERLAVLAEADVVDSGAAGYLYIAEGMRRILLGEEITYEATAPAPQSEVDLDGFGRDSVLTFGYCTEFLLRLTTAKVDPDVFDMAELLSLLEELGGESVVAHKQDDVVKVHVHTFRPGDVLSAVQRYGEFLTVKIENMNLGHSEAQKAAEESKKEKRRKDYAVVAVSGGAGMSALFRDMGADAIVCGGQSSNPSAEDFLRVFKTCDAPHILVLPNNKNIILAARQAAELYTDATVHVLTAGSMARGYAALSVINPGIKDIDALIASAERAAADVIDGEITRAVRHATLDGFTVREGHYMAIGDGKLLAVCQSAEQAVTALLEASDIDLCEIITLFVGKDVSAERRAALTETLREIYGEYEIVVYEGGQEVYDYLVAVE